MKSCNRITMVGLILAAAVLVPLSPATAKTLRGLLSWPPILQTTHIWPEYAKRVTKATNGSLTFTKSGPEVVPPFEQMEPLQKGLFQLLLTTGGYHAGTTPILSTFDSIKPDPTKVRQTGLFDWADRFYRKKLGVKVLAIIPTGAYQIMTTKKPGPDGRLTGMKIRGTSVYHPLIRNLGASPVVLPARQVFPALQKGVVDGIAWPRYAVAMFKMYQAGLKYSMSPYFGQATIVLLMNSQGLPRPHARPTDGADGTGQGGRAVGARILRQDHRRRGRLPEIEGRQVHRLGPDERQYSQVVQQGRVGQRRQDRPQVHRRVQGPGRGQAHDERVTSRRPTGSMARSGHRAVGPAPFPLHMAARTLP